MNFRNEFYYDRYLGELGESLENNYAQEDRILLKKLERRLLHALTPENQKLLIHFLDAHRRQFLRAEGNSYMMGFFMGLDAGKIIEKYELRREE